MGGAVTNMVGGGFKQAAGLVGQSSPFLNLVQQVSGAGAATPPVVDTPAPPPAVPGYVDPAVSTPAGREARAAAATASAGPATPAAGGGSYRDMIINSAKRWGIDPDTALRVAKSEGGTDKYIRSQYKKNGKQEPSYGPFQLLVGGGDTGFPEGMGNQMIRETGLDPRDPKNAQAAIDFAMREASRKGWGQWYGAKKLGITGFAGIQRGVNGGDILGPGGPSGPASPETMMAQAPAQTQQQMAQPPLARVLAAIGGEGPAAGAPTAGGGTAEASTPQDAFARVMSTVGRSRPQMAAGGGEEAGGGQPPTDLGAQEVASLAQQLDARRTQPSLRRQDRKARLTARTRGQKV